MTIRWHFILHCFSVFSVSPWWLNKVVQRKKWATTFASSFYISTIYLNTDSLFAGFLFCINFLPRTSYLLSSGSYNLYTTSLFAFKFNLKLSAGRNSYQHFCLGPQCKMFFPAVLFQHHVSRNWSDSVLRFYKFCTFRGFVFAVLSHGCRSYVTNQRQELVKNSTKAKKKTKEL